MTRSRRSSLARCLPLVVVALLVLPVSGAAAYVKPPGGIVEACGAGAVRLASKPKVRKFRTAGGRYAVGKQKRGSTLITPVGVDLKAGGKKVKGTLLMLWDDSGRLATTASVDLGDCDLDFAARKAR